jgi:hypothetical protein
MIEAKVTQLDDLYFLEIMRNPALFTEFVNNYDNQPGDAPFELTDYQEEFILDASPYVSLCCSRAVGKTVSLSSLIIWYLVYNTFPTQYIVYGAPGKVHLDPVWANLVRMFRTNNFLKQFVHPSSGFNSSEYKITLINQATLLCRIAGQSGTGQNFVGLHTSVVLLDEGAYFPWATFMELQPILNTFIPGYKMMMSGVPDGRRERSCLFHCDQENSNYSKHRVNSFQNPRFSEKDKAFAIEQYGGVDSDEYQHAVLGLHGKPVFALFDRGNFAFGDDPVYKLTLNGTQIGEMLSEYLTKIDIFPSLPSKEDKAILCVDLGYTEPTAIIILYQDRLGRLRFHGRIEMTKVSYPIQEKLLNVLDSKFNPALIGIDRGAGGQGISVVQHMMEDLEYAHKDYQKRLVPVDFSTSIVIGIDSDGNEIKSKTKPFATSVLQEYANNHKIMFSHKDLEMVNELERMTYSRTPTGEIVYKTLTQKGGKSGSDHFTAALLCGIMAYYIKNDFMLYKSERKVLARPSWI